MLSSSTSFWPPARKGSNVAMEAVYERSRTAHSQRARAGRGHENPPMSSPAPSWQPLWHQCDQLDRAETQADSAYHLQQVRQAHRAKTRAVQRRAQSKKLSGEKRAHNDAAARSTPHEPSAGAARRCQYARRIQIRDHALRHTDETAGERSSNRPMGPRLLAPFTESGLDRQRRLGHAQNTTA